MQGLVEAGHLLVGPVDRKRVLDQVVRTDRQEVHLGGELTGDQNRRRHLDHGADLDVPPMVDSFSRQLGADFRTEAAQRPDLLNRRHHRNHDAQVAESSRPKQGTQLAAEDVGASQSQPDAAQTEDRVLLFQLVEAAGGLASAQVERTDHDRPGRQSFEKPPDDGQVLFLRGQIRTLLEVEELAPVETDSGRAEALHVLELLGNLHIGEQFDSDAVAASCRQLSRCRREHLFLLPAAALKDPVELQGLRRRVQREASFFPVDDHRIVIGNAVRDVHDAGDQGNVQCAGDDRRVGVGASDLDREAHGAATAQAQDLVRRQFVADDDDIAIEIHADARAALLAGQGAQKVAGDVAKIFAALAQMLALDLRELLAEVVGYRLYRPLGVDSIFPNRLVDPARKGGVSQDHRMGMEDGRQIAAERFRYPAFGGLQFDLDGPHRGAETFNLPVQVVAADRHAQDLDTVTAKTHGRPDRDARGGGRSLQRLLDGRGPAGRPVQASSPKRARIRSQRASMAARSSSPRQRTVSLAPCPAPSSRTPRMLFASVSRPLARSTTLDWNWFAVCTSLAAARA